MAGAVALLITGCLGPWRPSSDKVLAPSSLGDLDLAPYLRSAPTGRWVYERRELPVEKDQPPTRYVRRVTPRRIIEGVLEEREFLPIERYLEPQGDAATQPAGDERPRAPLEGGTALFFRLAEPSETVPRDLKATGPVSSTTGISYFDYRGLLAAQGTLRREVEIEGTEDVDCPAGRFERCLRVRVDLRIHFPWVSITNLTSYLWLSPEVGEVRRVERLSGWFLIFWFGSAHEYRLTEYTPGADVVDLTASHSPKWACGALLLEGAFPHTQIAGMVVDVATGTAAP